MADRERHEHPPQRLGPGSRQVGNQLDAVGREHPTVDDGVLRIRLLGGAGVERHGDESRHGLLRIAVRPGGEVEQIALVSQDLGLEQRDGTLPAERLDVEGTTGRQGEQPLTELGRAVPRVRATDVLVALFLRSQLGAALGAV